MNYWNYIYVNIVTISSRFVFDKLYISNHKFHTGSLGSWSWPESIWYRKLRNIKGLPIVRPANIFVSLPTGETKNRIKKNWTIFTIAQNFLKSIKRNSFFDCTLFVQLIQPMTSFVYDCFSIFINNRNLLVNLFPLNTGVA